MSETKSLGNYQAIRKVMGAITKEEWAALTSEERKELGDEARKTLETQAA